MCIVDVYVYLFYGLSRLKISTLLSDHQNLLKPPSHISPKKYLCIIHFLILARCLKIDI